MLLLPISAQFWPTPPSPQNYLPLVTLGWIVIGAAILLWPASRARGVLARVGAFAPDEEVEADAPVTTARTRGYSRAMNPETLDMSSASTAAQRIGAALKSAELVDLSWSLDEHGPVFPGQEGLVFEKLGDVNDPDLPLCFNQLSFMEHIGTHMDAPAHAIDGGRFVDELPFAELAGPAFKLDLTERCGGRADYDVGAEDIARFERDHGRIPDGSIVLLHTGWDARYVAP